MSKVKLRGRQLENHFEMVFKKLNQLPNVVAIRVEVKKLQCGAYKDKQPCDFIVRTRQSSWWLDTKECSADTWYPSHAPAHQRTSLKKLQTLGCKAGFVVWFKNHENQTEALRFIEDFSQPATAKSGAKFSWEMFLE